MEYGDTVVVVMWKIGEDLVYGRKQMKIYIQVGSHCLLLCARNGSQQRSSHVQRFLGKAQPFMQKLHEGIRSGSNKLRPLVGRKREHRVKGLFKKIWRNLLMWFEGRPSSRSDNINIDPA